MTYKPQKFRTDYCALESIVSSCEKRRIWVMWGKEGMDSRGTNKEEPTGSGEPLDQGGRGRAYI